MKQGGETCSADLFDPAPRITLKSGEVAYCTGTLEHDLPLFFLWEGAVRTYRITRDGREMTTGLYAANSEWKLICMCGQQDCFEALKPTIYVRVAKGIATRALARCPDTLAGVLNHILCEFEHAFCKQEDLAFREVPIRLTHLLVTLGEKFGEPDKRGKRIALKLSQEKLATMTGSSRPAVNIALKQLKEAGLICICNKEIILLDPESPMKMCNKNTGC